MLSFQNATGNLFNRLGKLGLLVKQMRAYQLAQLTNYTSTSTGAVGQYAGESDLQALLGGAYIGDLASAESPGTTAAGVAAQTVNRMVFRDNPRISQTLQALNLTASIAEVIRQMQVAGAAVLQMTVAASATPFTGNGNAVINTSVQRPTDGRVLENSFAETLQLLCTGDSYAGGGVAYDEPYQLTGTGGQGDPWAFNWPLGSNARVQLNAINGDANNTQGNLLTNSGFTSWTVTPNVPDNWTLSPGTAGTNVVRETGVVYPTASAVKLLGDGSTLTALAQGFGSGSGTRSVLQPQTQYSWCGFFRCGPTPPGTGALVVELIDQNGNVVKDAAGNNNTFTVSLTGLNQVYTGYTGVFRTPEIMPASVTLRLRLSAALSNGAAVYIDKVSLGAMTQAYPSGPYVAVHSGSVPATVGDYATVSVTNSRGAGGALDTFQTLWARLLWPTMISNGFLLPSSSTPTIPDTLIG